MTFGLAEILTEEVLHKSFQIFTLSEGLKAFFDDKFYGTGVKNFTIRIVCVAPAFDQFFYKTKPKYTKGKKEMVVHGIPFTLEDSVEYRIKIDFESFKNADGDEGLKILAKEILSSISVFDQMKSKIKDFDVVKFKADLEVYFKSRDLI